MSLAGKVALVTGGAQGLGKAFSEVLLKRGAKVCVADVKVQQGEATVSDFQQQYRKGIASFFKCDVTKESDFKDTFDVVKQRFGRLDIVVNNAGISDSEQWRKMIDINLTAVIQGTKLAMDAMSRENGGEGGLIVNIGSLAGLIPVPIASEYAASKWGVVGYTLSLAQLPNVDSMGLRFACMCPAFVDTEMITPLKEADDITRRYLDMEGIMPVSQMKEAFEQLLDSPNNNGVIVEASLKRGIIVKRNVSKL